MEIKAILTGHTRGLGEAIATQLLAKGIPVLGIARTQNPALLARFPEIFVEHQFDLSDAVGFAQWLQSGTLFKFANKADQLLLINNAGVLGPIGELNTQDPAYVARAIAINVSAPMMLSGYASSLGCKATRVLHVSSGAAREAYPNWSVYCATKAALDHHARAVNKDGQKNLRICSLAPGVIDTDMQAEIRNTDVGLFPMRIKFIGLKVANLLTTPDDAAKKLVAFLLSNNFGSEPAADLRSIKV
jgi:benzil reductase ((S)-benzoin forming)